jgi:hypothetical protein
MLISILCNKLLLDQATSHNESSQADSLFSRATKTGTTRARSNQRAAPSQAEPLQARAFSSRTQVSLFPPSVCVNRCYRDAEIRRSRLFSVFTLEARLEQPLL